MNDHRHSPKEGLKEGRIQIFRRSADDQDTRLSHFLCLAEPPVASLIHEEKQHFLSIGRQAVDLIQKQNASVCLFHQSGFVLFSSGKSAFFVAKQLGKNQFLILGILRAVKDNKSGIFLHHLHGFGILVQFLRKCSLTCSSRTCQQRVQTIGRIQHRRLPLLNLRFQRSVLPDHKSKFFRFPLLRLRFPVKFCGNKFDRSSVQLHCQSLPRKFVQISAHIAPVESQPFCNIA